MSTSGKPQPRIAAPAALWGLELDKSKSDEDAGIDVKVVHSGGAAAEGGLKAGDRKTYDVTITRTSGSDKAVRHELSIENNAGDTFRIVGKDEVKLPLNQPVTVKVQAKPRSAGIKSAIFDVDDPSTEGVDKQILATVVVSNLWAHMAPAA